MAPSLFRQVVVWSLSLVFWLCHSSSATAAPRDELLRLVPPDVGFCLVVQDLRSHSTTFLSSEFAARLCGSPLGQALADSPEIRRLARVEDVLRNHLGIGLSQLRDEILGDAVVVAYRPGPPGKPEAEQGVFLVRARDADLLATLVQRCNRVQKESGEVKEVLERVHAGQTYFRRVGTSGDSFYYLNGPVFVLSPQEAMIRQVLDLDRNGPVAVERPVARELRLLGVENHLAALWINPKAFTSEIEWKKERAGAAQAAALDHFLQSWKSLDGIALSARAGKAFELMLSVRARTEELPPAARKLFRESAQSAALWARFPDKALLATAGRVDVESLQAILLGLLTPETRESLHDALGRYFGALSDRHGIREMLAHVGPEWGLCVLAPSAGDRAWFPHAVLALQVRPGTATESFDQTLVAALHSFALLKVLAYNRQHKDQLALMSVRQDETEIRYLAGEQTFPPGLQPAFALQGGFLVLGSSPDALRRLGPTSSLPAKVEGKDEGAGELPLLRMSLQEWRRYLAERYEQLIAASAERNRISRDEAKRGLDGLMGVTQLLDGVELSQRSRSGLLTLTLRLEPRSSK